jgi:hypothetical protein
MKKGIANEPRQPLPTKTWIPKETVNVSRDIQNAKTQSLNEARRCRSAEWVIRETMGRKQQSDLKDGSSEFS